MQIYVSKGCLDKNIKNIIEFLKLDLVTTLSTNESYFQYNKDGLSFVEDSSNPRSILHVDFLKGKLGWRLKRAQHEGNLKKALGKKDKKLFIFDATAGLLSDTMIFLSLGHKVVAAEQSKILFCLVNDAIQRARDKIPYLNNLEFLNDNSQLVYKKQDKVFDVIYLDPMYPIIKKSTKKRGSINNIKQILEIEHLVSDEEEIIDIFMKYNYKKIIVKRPLKSEKKYSNINYQVKGKTTRFDIYI
jgi:16S rRNA (guanine1516-N2)-methyltransferase